MQPNLPNGEWRDSILRIITHLPSGALFTSDDIRIKANEKGLPAPKRSGQWGEIMVYARKQKLIGKTGRYVPSQIPSNHGAILTEWRKL
jgi:hypothetical protein